MSTEETTPESKNSTYKPVERQWLSAVVKRKNYKKFSEQISNWFRLPEKQYFTEGLLNNVAKKIRGNEYAGIENPTAIKGLSKLPLSGDALSFNFIDRESCFQFALSSSKFLSKAEFKPDEWSELREESATYTTIIQNSRNTPLSDENTDELLLHGHDVEFFVQVTNIARAFCGPFAKADFFSPCESSKNLACIIDNQLFTLLLAIESLDLAEMAKACSAVMNRFASGAELFYEFCQSICDEEKSIENLKQMGAVAGQIATYCDEYKKNEMNGEIGNGHEIASLCGKFLKITKKPIGDVVVKSAGSQDGFFKYVTWDPKNAPSGSPEFETADRLAVKMIGELFSPSKAPKFAGEQGVERYTTEFINAATFLRKEFCSDQYVDLYGGTLAEVEQLIDSLSDSQVKDQAMTQTEVWRREISERLGYLTDGGPADIKITECIVKSPNFYHLAVKELYVEKGLEYIFTGRIAHFEKTAFGGDGGKEGLVSIFKDKLELKIIERVLNDAMSRLKKANTIRVKKIDDINRFAKGDIARISSDKYKGIISTGKENFESEYNTLFEELKGDLKKSDLSPEKLLDNFENKVSLIIDTYVNILEESGYTGDNSASGVGVLMIGMGQGGQQILRASMAKMLNTLTDERSRNMLNGLGIDKAEMDEIKSILADYDDVIDIEGDELKKLTTIFDKVGILAMNLGPELKHLLSQPYNFIWGNSDSKELKHGSDGKLRRLATNLALLDPNSKGCGGKMGRGRAFAVDAEEPLGTILAEKAQRRTITQVCLIHSFTGGSGSGMVLPMLRKIKHTYPEAIVWVLSAGDGQAGGARNGPQNVTYITSDILQSHYNALHHSPQKIDLNRWRRYARLSVPLSKLNEKWDDEIKPYFTALNNQNKKVLEDKVSLGANFDRDFERSNMNQALNKRARGPFSSLPKNKEQSELFESIISDPTTRSAEDLWNAWISWIQLAEDNGSRELRLAAENEPIFSDPKKNFVPKERFKTNRGHFIKIAQKLSRKVRYDADIVDESDEEEDQLFSQFVSSLDVESLAKNNVTIEELIEEINRYARMMRDYHHQLYEMTELISLNKGASDDPTVKHIIVSNAHLDPAAGEIYQGRQEKFEIYNSTMTEVFVNIVHSLVNESDDVLSLENNGIISSSYEVMDVSDMRNRTKPTTTAMVLELEDMSKISHIVRHDPKTKVNNDLFKIFEELLMDAKSPLYDDVEDFNSEILKIGTLNELFINYFQNESDGLLKYRPRDVIKAISVADIEQWNSAIMNANDTVKCFYESVFNSTEIENFSTKGITQQTVDNMYEWIRILPLKIFEQLPGHNESSWGDLTKSWRTAQEHYRKIEIRGHPLNKSTREAVFYQFIIGRLSGSEEDKKDNATLLTEIYELYGIIDLSHLAAIPSALILDTMAKMYDSNTIKFKSSGKVYNFDSLKSRHSSVVAFSIDHGRDMTDKANTTMKLPKDIKITVPTCLRLNQTGQGNYLLEPSKIFYQIFSRVKQEAIKEHPEFATSTIFEMLVQNGSNPSDTSLTSRPEEIPSLIKATSQLLNFGVVTPKHLDEKPTSQFFRHLLLGTPPVEMSREQRVVYSIDMVEHFQLIAIAVTKDLPLDLSENFTSQQMQSTIYNRLDRFVESEIIVENRTESDVEAKDYDLAVLEELRTCIGIIDRSGDDGKQMNLRTFYVDLETVIKEREPQFIIAKQVEGYEPVLLQSHLNGLERVCSYLQSLTFSVKRQEKFLKGQMKPGEGVSFQFQGSIDAMRSQTKDFIAVVNTTTSIKPDQIRNSARIFFKDFGGDRKGDGKVFIQNLKSGPTASITLMSEQAATIEIVKNFQSVVTKMKHDGLAPITETLVHPYSFLRNMLWMSTFRNVWLQKSSATVTDVFDIPVELIKTVFGRPTSIEQAINAVQQSGDMAGVNLSRYDTEAWKYAKYVKPFDDLTKDEQKHRLRSQLTIADMLFINLAYLKAINEHTDKSDRKNKFEDYIGNPGSLSGEFKGIFDKNLNKTKILTFNFSDVAAGDSNGSGEDSDLPPWEQPGGDEDTGNKKMIEALEAGLKEWISYAAAKSGNDSGGADDTPTAEED